MLLYHPYTWLVEPISLPVVITVVTVGNIDQGLAYILPLNSCQRTGSPLCGDIAGDISSVECHHQHVLLGDPGLKSGPNGDVDSKPKRSE